MTSSSAPADLRGRALLILLLLLLLAGGARAHDESISASDVLVEGAQVIWTVEAGVAGLAKVIPLGQEMAAGERAILIEQELEARRPAIAAYLAGGLQLWLDGQPAAAEIARLSPRYERLPGSSAPVVTRVALELRYRGGRAISRLRARVALFADLTDRHRAVVRVTWAGETRQMALLGARELDLEKGRLTPSPARLVGEFVSWGVHHIAMGLDHLAFLLALMLAIVRVRELLLVITSFTVAHSLTIFLAASDRVRMPVAITEALIAASIVYLAAENLLLSTRSGAGRGRWAVAFLFGLVHGLGFAEVLRERLAETPGSLILPVLAFNLGVELGQMVAVALVFPILWWLRRQGAAGPAALETRRKQILRWGSWPLLAAGLVWLVARIG